MNAKIPFRWNLKHSEQLGGLLEGEIAPSYNSFMDDVRDCCAKILSMTKNSDIVFVGRSPESLYDYLKGITEKTSYEDRVHMLNISVRDENPLDIIRKQKRYKHLQEYFQHLKLDPFSLVRRKHPVMFVDIVCDGYTFETIYKIIKQWSEHEKIDFAKVKLKIRFLGLTWRVHSARYAERWWKEYDWPRELRSEAVKNIAIENYFWRYIGNDQQKVENSYRPKFWGKEEVTKPIHDKNKLAALRLAHKIYTQAKNKEEQLKLSRLLSNRVAMRNEWLRRINHEIKYKRGAS